MYNASIDTTGVWNFNSFTNFRYVNSVNYVNLDRDATAEKNYTRTTSLGQRLGLSYRNDWLEVELSGNVDYQINKNKLQPNSNMNTWNYSYGTDITITAPWGTGFSTSAHMSSRRGYADATANTNEFIWNAQISQSFLDGKPLTVSLQFYDMLHVIFRFNAFGGKEARQQQRQGNREGGPGGDRPRGNFQGGFPGGGPGGGFGGGRRF